MALPEILASLGNSLKVFKRGNAFTPFAFFAIFLIVILIYFAASLHGTLQLILIILVCFIVGFSCLMYLLLFLKDPRLLQSETYRLEEQKLNIIQEKGGNVIFEPVSLTPNQAGMLNADNNTDA